LPSGLLRLLATRVNSVNGSGSSEVWEEHVGAASAAVPVSASPLQVNPAEDSPPHAVSWKRVCAVPIESGFSLAQFLGFRYLFFAFEDGRIEYRHR
jgi:hypothetical protein